MLRIRFIDVECHLKLGIPIGVRRKPGDIVASYAFALEDCEMNEYMFSPAKETINRRKSQPVRFLLKQRQSDVFTSQTVPFCSAAFIFGPLGFVLIHEKLESLIQVFRAVYDIELGFFDRLFRSPIEIGLRGFDPFRMRLTISPAAVSSRGSSAAKTPRPDFR
jgi:hypothetical protein